MLLTANQWTEHRVPDGGKPKQLKERQPNRRNNNMNHPVPTELPRTKPPTKEYTWRDTWLQPHMYQRMALAGINGGEALSPVKAQCPSVGKHCGREAGVGG